MKTVDGLQITTLLEPERQYNYLGANITYLVGGFRLDGTGLPDFPLLIRNVDDVGEWIQLDEEELNAFTVNSVVAFWKGIITQSRKNF